MKKTLVYILALVMLLSVLPVFSITTSAEQSEEWIAISTKEDLFEIRNNPGGNYYLTTNIVFSVSDFLKNGNYYNDGYGWQGADIAFTGVFDGRGYSISGLSTYKRFGIQHFITNNVGTIKNLVYCNLNIEYIDEGGFFVKTNTGTIENCVFSDIYYGPDSYNSTSMSVVGTNNGTISNCTIENIEATNSTKYTYCGFAVENNGTIDSCKNDTTVSQTIYDSSGICLVNNATIKNCVNTMSVTISENMIAGIVCENNGLIDSCYNSGTLIYNATGYSYKAVTYCGGIAAYNAGEIYDCYNAGNVTVANEAYTVYAGGICGVNDSGIVKNTINTATVSPKADFFYDSGIFTASFIGLYNSGLAKNNYYYKTVGEDVIYNSSANLSLPIACTQAQLKTESTYSDLSSEKWYFKENSYPLLSGCNEDTVKGIFIKRVPDKTSYTTKTTIDYTGLLVSKVLNFGEIVILGDNDYTTTGTIENYGNNTITVEYNGFKTEFDILLRIPMNLCETYLENSSYTYRGSEITPDITVAYNGRVLKENIDYTLSYSNNVNVGTANVIVQGIGKYTDTLTDTFEITPCDISDVTISNLKSKVYNHQPQSQSAILTYNGLTLVEGSDYTVSYQNNVNVGTATITFTGSGNYKGTTNEVFVISPASIKDAIITNIFDKKYNQKAHTQSAILNYNGKILVEGEDYTVSYKNNVSAGTATVIFEGCGNYAQSKKVTFKIAPISIKSAIITGVTDKIYNYAAQTQRITVTNNNISLVNGKDYTISYKNNTKIGTATVIITGKGNYMGSQSKTFKIKTRSFSSVKVTGINNKTYNGSYLKQNITVKDGSRKLKLGTDYKVTYKNNKYPGKATITITGINNYKGFVTKTFTISKASPKLTAKLSINSGKTTLTGKWSASAKSKITYSLSNKGMAQITSSGKLTIKKPGKLTITFKATGTKCYKSQTKKITFTVYKKNGKLYIRK